MSIKEARKQIDDLAAALNDGHAKWPVPDLVKISESLEKYEDLDRFLTRSTEELEPMIRGTAVTLTINPGSGKLDPKIAIETGYSVLLSKPIVVVAKPGEPVPEGLRRAATEIVTWDGTSKNLEETLKPILDRIATPRTDA